MGAMASQITSLTIVYSTVYSGADQRIYQSCASLAFVWGIHRWPVNSPHKRPVTRKMFPFDDVIMLWVFSVHFLGSYGTLKMYEHTDWMVCIYVYLTDYFHMWYRVQPLTLERAWTLFIIGFLPSFSRILWYLFFLWIQWLTCVWNSPLLPLYSPQYIMDPVRIWNSHWSCESINPFDYGIYGYFSEFCGTLKICEYRLTGVFEFWFVAAL